MWSIGEDKHLEGRNDGDHLDAQRLRTLWAQPQLEGTVRPPPETTGRGHGMLYIYIDLYLYIYVCMHIYIYMYVYICVCMCV